MPPQHDERSPIWTNSPLLDFILGGLTYLGVLVAVVGLMLAAAMQVGTGWLRANLAPYQASCKGDSGGALVRGYREDKPGSPSWAAGVFDGFLTADSTQTCGGVIFATQIQRAIDLYGVGAERAYLTMAKSP
jgi:hypothetical protein